MLINLDTRDLINLLDGKARIDFSDFNAALRAGPHHIVICTETAVELSLPLLEPNAATNVMALLLKLEKLPLKFLNEVRVPPLELIEAIAAFDEGREYNAKVVNPFVDRFDACIHINGRPFNEILRADLAETIYILWQEDPHLFELNKRHAETLRELISQDRALPVRPLLRKQFVEKIKSELALYKIREPRKGAEAFAKWVYESPERCPGIRLSYEVYHQIVKNKSAQSKTSDLVDLARLRTVSYSDMFTTDSAMLAYAKQASRAMGGSPRRMVSDFDAVISALRS